MNKFDIMTQKLLKAGVVATFSAVGTAMFITGQEQANSIEPEEESDTLAVDGMYSAVESIQRERVRLMSPEIDYQVSLSRNSVVNIQQSSQSNNEESQIISYKGNLVYISHPENISIYRYQSVVDDSDNELNCDRPNCNSQSIPENFGALGLVAIASIGFALHCRGSAKTPHWGVCTI